MGTKAYAYYLAAYLVWGLKNYDVSDSATIDYTIYNLNSCGYNSDAKSRLQENYKTLTLSQSKTFLSYLKFMANLSSGAVDFEAAQKAIDCYWYKYA